MRLRVLTETAPRNLGVISHVLEEMGGDEVVEFTTGTGAGVLRWTHQDPTRYSVHVAVPMRWLSEEEQVERVKEAARHFAHGVRAASGR